MKQSDFEFSVKYVEHRLARCESRIDLNANQRQAYAAILLAAKAGEEEYTKTAGDFFSVRRAEDLDRAQNLSQLYADLGYSEAEQAARALAEQIKISTGYSDIISRGSAERQAMVDAVSLEHSRRNALLEYAASLISYASSPQKEKAGRREEVRRAHASIRNLDPEFNWDRFRSHKAYRNSLYYNESQIQFMMETERDCLEQP